MTSQVCLALNSIIKIYVDCGQILHPELRKNLENPTQFGYYQDLMFKPFFVIFHSTLRFGLYFT